MEQPEHTGVRPGRGERFRCARDVPWAFSPGRKRNRRFWRTARGVEIGRRPTKSTAV